MARATGQLDDPARGYLVTANNRVVSAIDGTGDYFCTDTHPPYRARRIEELDLVILQRSAEPQTIAVFPVTTAAIVIPPMIAVIVLWAA